MDYLTPINGDQADANRSYINGNKQTGTEGSIPSAESFEHPQREILEVIAFAGLTLDQNDLTQLRQAIQAMVSNTSNNVGQFAFCPVDVDPDNCIDPNGGLRDVTLFPELFAVYGTAFGGDGVTTFGIPEVRGEYIRIWDDGRGIDSGRNLMEVQSAQVGSHSVTVTGTSGSNTGGNTSVKLQQAEGGAGSASFTAGTGENRVRSVAVKAMIIFK